MNDVTHEEIKTILHLDSEVGRALLDAKEYAVYAAISYKAQQLIMQGIKLPLGTLQFMFCSEFNEAKLIRKEIDLIISGAPF